jgi:hypothetical protein
MRGFRGSRSAQNQIASRFGRGQDYSGFRSTHAGQSQNGPATGDQRTQLPDWLKTPETKAREAVAPSPSPSRPASQLQVQTQAQAQPVAKQPVARQPVTKPQLRLVASAPAREEQPKTASKARKAPKAKAKPRAAASKSKAAARPKRKAA